MPERRQVLAAAAVAAATLAIAPPALAEPKLVRLRLPAPSGPHEIGTVSLHLVDRSRPDPWLPSVPYRELMTSVWYPAVRTSGCQLAPHMEPGAAERWDAVNGHGIPPGTVDWAATRTHAYRAAPVDPSGGRRPVVVYSAGTGDPRTWGTVLVEELASRGYVVVTVDHTYESPGVQFPDGSVKNNDILFEEFERASRDDTVPVLLEKVLSARLADVRFTLDQLGTPLPLGLSQVLDPRLVGMVGQSAGGFTAAQGMYEDSRIMAGVDLDGTLEFNSEPVGTNLSPVAVHGLDRPFLLMGSEGNDVTTEPSWRAFHSQARGWCADLTLRGSRHQTYTDLAAVMAQTGVPGNVVEDEVGTIDPGRAVAAVRAYVTSFFDRWLRHQDDHLLDGPSPRYPEVAFVR